MLTYGTKAVGALALAVALLAVAFTAATSQSLRSDAVIGAAPTSSVATDVGTYDVDCCHH